MAKVKSKKMTGSITFRICPEERVKLDKICTEKGISYSTFFRILAIEKIATYKKTGKISV